MRPLRDLTVHAGLKQELGDEQNTLYNKPTETCRELDPQDPPYVTLDYLQPSAQYPEQYTAASDPTRILYYGHSLARAFKSPYWKMKSLFVKDHWIPFPWTVV
jgi:hypothetical protein